MKPSSKYKEWPFLPTKVCSQWTKYTPDEGLLLADPVSLLLFHKHLCDSFSQSLSFPSKIFKHIKSQIVRASDQPFWHHFHHPLSVMCHMSGIRCLVSDFRYHVSIVTVRCHKSLYLLKKQTYKVLELVGGGSLINRTTLSSFYQLQADLEKKIYSKTLG